MIRRYRWLFALLLLVAASFLLPAVHWRVIGWVRGEAFYQGRPTTYWSQEARTLQLKGYVSYGSVGSASISRIWVCSPSLTERYWEVVTGNGKAPFALLEQNQAALPVLLELLNDASPQVRLIAVDSLCCLGPEAQPAVPTLLALCLDENETVRDAAIQTVELIDRGAAICAGVKKTWP